MFRESGARVPDIFTQECQLQWSNYNIIYEGPESMASDSEPRKIFFEAPSRPPQKSHFGKQKACEGEATNE